MEQTNYQWDENAEIKLNGTEFAVIFKTLISREEILLKELASITILKNKLKEMVDTGIAMAR